MTAGTATAVAGVVAGVSCLLVEPMLMVPELATCAVCADSCTIAAASAPTEMRALPPITDINVFTATPPSSPSRHKVSAQTDIKLDSDCQLAVVWAACESEDRNAAARSL